MKKISKIVALLLGVWGGAHHIFTVDQWAATWPPFVWLLVFSLVVFVGFLGVFNLIEDNK